MGIRGPELRGTGNIQSNVAWYISFGLNPPNEPDSVTYEASLYRNGYNTLRQVRPWRGCGAAEWTRLQWNGYCAAFCGGQSA